MENSRTKKGLKNSFFNVFVYLMNILCSFIVRTVFIYVLDKEYLGVNGLFTNILSFLSLAEMGIGTSIVYALYKPLAVGDTDKVKALMNFYKKAYQYIAIVVACAGLSLIPFLENLINDKPNIPENLYVIYLFYLLNSVASYLFVYKKSLLVADQKEYIASIVNLFYYVGMSVLQIVILVVYHNFMAYLVIQIFSAIAHNVAIAIICNKKYPYILHNDEKLEKKEQQQIFNDVKALIIYRVAALILNSTDNLVLSKGVGLVAVGIYSNYYLITHAVYTLIRQALTALAASIGNLNVTQDTEKKELVFRTTTFMASALYGFAAILFYVVLNDFVLLWAGEGYLFDKYIVVVLIINFYLTGISGIYNVLRGTFGLFVQGKLRPLLSAAINIILSIILVKTMGTIGVFLGTAIAFISVNFWYDPYIVYKFALKRKFRGFVLNNISYVFVYAIIAIICEKTCRIIKFQNAWFSLIVDTIIAIIICLAGFALFFGRKQEVYFLKDKVKGILKGVRK